MNLVNQKLLGKANLLGNSQNAEEVKKMESEVDA